MAKRKGVAKALASIWAGGCAAGGAAMTLVTELPVIVVDVTVAVPVTPRSVAASEITAGTCA